MQARERRVKLEKLASLDDIYIEVMYYRFDNKSVPEINSLLKINNLQTVYNRFTQIYKNLGITGNDKEGDLIRGYSPLFLEFFKSEDDLKNWGRIRAEMLRQIEDLPSAVEAVSLTENPDKSASELSSSDTQETQNVSESASTTSSSQDSESQQSDKTNQEKPVQNRFPWYVIAVPLFIVCLLCIAGSVFARQFIPFLQPTQSPQTQVPASTQTLLATSTLPVIASETASPTSTFTALPPSSTSAPTDTPLPTTSPTSSAPSLFFDDFTNGKSDQWQIVYGDDPPIVNNALNFTSTTLMVIDASEWTDYQVSFDVSNIQCQVGVRSSGVTVGLRYQNANNMTALRIAYWGDHCEAVWYTIKNGEWEQIPNSNFPLPPKDSNGVRHWVIDVQGNTYGTPFGPSIVIEDFSTGGVSLLVDTSVTIDNFRVAPLTP